MAAMGAALGAMVGWMTYGKRRFEDRDAAVRAALPPLHRAMTELIPVIDEDTAAFNDYLAALGLPRDTPEQAAARESALQDGLRKAVAVPLRAMRIADGCWDAMAEMARHGNPASRSDLEVGARALEAGIWGAGRNVIINLEQVADAAFREATRADVDALTDRAARRLAEVLATAHGGHRGGGDRGHGRRLPHGLADAAGLLEGLLHLAPRHGLAHAAAGRVHDPGGAFGRTSGGALRGPGGRAGRAGRRPLESRLLQLLRACRHVHPLSRT
jgi:formiminotetrahydrofolate cyclodeaminase